MFDVYNGMEPGDMPIAGLSYMLFMSSGEPGYYMLYNDLVSPTFSLIDDDKKDRLLE